jgi:hypothetical protein
MMPEPRSTEGLRPIRLAFGATMSATGLTAAGITPLYPNFKRVRMRFGL